MKKRFSVIPHDPRLVDRYFSCCSNSCMYRRECAQHVTAGDFRMEGGFTPDVVLLNGRVLCASQNSPASSLDEDTPSDVVDDGCVHFENGRVQPRFDRYLNDMDWPSE